MTTARYGPAVATTNGKVLVAGGATNVGFGSGAEDKLVELFDPAGVDKGVFALPGASANLSSSRYFPSAAPLPNGKVLIVGGFTEGGVTLTSAAIYDPIAETTTTLPVETQTSGPETQMHTAREDAFAAPLADGQVLVGGGRDNEALRSAELFDPSTNDFTTTEAMESPREGAAAAPLPDGKVLIVGGKDNLGHVLASVEIYDPSTGGFAEPPESMATPRVGAVASPLPDGKVLIAGGSSGGTGVLRSAEVFDPTAHEFTPLPESGASQLTIARLSGAAAPLPDGRVLILGGTHDTTDALSSAEVFESSPEAEAADANFGNQTINASSSKSITVSNRGDQALEVEGFGLEGPDPADFSVGASTCASPVAFEGTCKFTLDFKPGALGERVATVRLSDNEPVPLTLIVKGTGVKEVPKGGEGSKEKPMPGSASFDLLRCRQIKRRGDPKRSRCTVTSSPGTVELTSSSIRATLRQRGKFIASGRATNKKASQLDLTPSQELTPGNYKLTLSFRGRRRHRRSIVKTITIE
ncbi:MAG: choice-of-anchor D domain-containing protein [Solirubrobacterales bacterium]